MNGLCGGVWSDGLWKASKVTRMTHSDEALVEKDPVCGMALEPMTPSLDDGPNPELVDFTSRMWLGAPLAAAVYLASRSLKRVDG